MNVPASWYQLFLPSFLQNRAFLQLGRHCRALSTSNASLISRPARIPIQDGGEYGVPQTKIDEMAERSIHVTVEDEGLYKKSFIMHNDTRMQRLMKYYRRLLCTSCTDANLLQFWYQATKVGTNLRVLSLSVNDTKKGRAD